MTNGDKIRAMNNEELADFLDDNLRVENVALKWFDANYCDKCETHKGITADDTEIEFHDCETGVGCPHRGSSMKKWIESEAE